MLPSERSASWWRQRRETAKYRPSRLPTAQSPTRWTAPGGRSAAGIRSGSVMRPPRSRAQPLPRRRRVRPPGPGRVAAPDSRRSLVRRLFAVLAPLAAVVLLGGGPALAEPPFDVPEQVTDRAGVLVGDESAVEAAVADLQAEEQVQLFVVYVDSFDGLDPDEWATRTAELSGLGGNDVLFAVAVEDGLYTYNPPADFRLSDQEIEELVASDVRPELSAGDFDGAAVAFAEGLGSGGDSGGGSGLGTVAVVGGIAAVAGGAYLVTRSRRRRQGPPPTQRIERPDPHAGVPTEQLEAQASTALLELDEAVKTSRLDLD